ncbi:hypothetical protein HX017_08400 [Myroides marinus]|uniref:hypothetical protein n=1 Tax=Myroides marinus TaxID=703342 RepID=UPI002577E414|nr:hypothetical protein [Myroides marinus]MDM1346909.1 hypothetical protein [Myroides marinus]MDM1350407.1 hypothetical protein [Myroides marinus]MDM1354207.1 hypothetical protein [Myroides marinus]MDM1357614.1 hypothetical protein [Myroides marinus]MDM1361628.1 hypothetical protein [Myroides marinus]
MKKILLITSILLTTYTVFSQNSYPSLKEREDLSMYMDNKRENINKEFYEEYYNQYLTAISKNSHAEIGKSNTSSLPWNLILKHNPKTFFESVVNSITFQNLEDNKYMFKIKRPMSTEEINEQRTTGGFKVKDNLTDLLKIKIMSNTLVNTKKNKKVTIDNPVMQSTGSWYPKIDPLYLEYCYFNYLDNINDIEGDVNVQISLPTEYEVTEINQQQLGQTIEVTKELKIKILAFEDDALHFEILDNKTLDIDILFNEEKGGSYSFEVTKKIYDFFRIHANLDFTKFTREISKYSDSATEDKSHDNIVHVYTFQNKIGKFYLYRPIEKTKLTENLTLTLEHSYD